MMKVKDTHKLATEMSSVKSMQPGLMAGRVGRYGACTLSHEPIEISTFLSFHANRDWIVDTVSVGEERHGTPPCNLGGTANGPSSQSGGGVCLFRRKRRWKEFACHIQHYPVLSSPSPHIVPSPSHFWITGSTHIRTISSPFREPFTAFVR